MAKEKLVDKCRNMLNKSANKDYVRKRKCPNKTSADEKIFDKSKLKIQEIKNIINT